MATDKMTTALIEEAIVGYWGTRCPDFLDDCPVCQVWAEFDALSPGYVYPEQPKDEAKLALVRQIQTILSITVRLG